MGISHQLLILNMIMSFSVVIGEQGRILCTSPQYVEYGKTGSINCDFERDFYAVYWYYSTEVVTGLPILSFENSVKSGSGFDSREFDVHQNGSLVINQVTLEHDHSFTVIYVKTKETPITVEVLLIVTIKPTITHPRIDKCKQDRRNCFAEVYEQSEVSCSVHNIRPNIDLYWVTRTANGDRNISSDTSVSAGTIAFTSQASISKPFNQSQLLVVLVCKALDLPNLLETDESVILVENGNISISTVEPTTMQATYNSKFQLHCVESKVSNIVWKRKVSNGTFDNVAISFANENIVEEEYEQSFTIGQQGSLVISDVRVEHEGIYACIYSGDGLEGINTFEISVAVFPVPRYPLVDGCDRQYCTKKVEFEGNLTCAVKGIRPKISLKWRARYPESSSKISFRNQQLTAIVSGDGDTFDVSLTTEYVIKDASQPRITIECVVDAKESELSEMSTILDLRFQNGTRVHPTSDTVEHTKGSLAWMVVFIIPFILAICVASYFVFRKKKPRKTNTSVRQSDLKKPKPDSDEPEKEPLYHEISEAASTETDGDRPNNEMKKLKELRKRLLEAPSLDDLCQVPTIFIKFLAITEEGDKLQKFSTVTTMFKHVISRFFKHKQSEVSDQENQSDLLVESNHHALDKLAFSGLLMANRGNEIMWNKEKACKDIGEDLYQECVKLGILVESEGLYDDQLEVRFYDKLICHWYAAHYFSYRVSTYGREDAKKYLGVDPCEHQNFYRFSSGLHHTTSEEVKKYLKNLPNGSGDRLAILCDLEETGNLDNTKQTLKELFTDFKFVEIRQDDNKLLRMSTLQLCEFAHSLEISVPPLWLMECFVDVDNENGDMKLKDGLTVNLEMFKEVRIDEEKKELTKDNVCQILELAAKSRTLENIVFWRCLVPESLQESKELLASLQKAEVKVRWFSKPGEFYDLNFQSGHWEIFGGQELTDEKYAEEVDGFLATEHYNQ